MTDTTDKGARSRRAAWGTATAIGLVLLGALGARLADGDNAIAAVPQVAAAQAIAPAAPAVPFSFADLVARVAPAVVSVRVEEKIEAAEANGPEEEMMRRFFEQFGMPYPGNPGGQGERREGQGSGFVIDPDGYIVTNNHVVEGAEKITVVMSDGKTLSAKLIGTDPGTDVALIKVEPPAPMAHVTFGDDSKLRPGDWVVAVGNPFGLGGTVTAGIVSARGRNIGAGPYTDYLQIDAPINRGNSGGPAFNINGEVVGVNSAIYTPTGGSVGIGFAIPASTVQKVVGELRAKGSVTRGWLGVQIQAIDEDMAKAVGLPDAKGALVSSVQPGSPAEKAGFVRGDVVLKVNGLEVADNRALSRAVADLKPGDTAVFDVWRNSAVTTLTATIEVRDEARIRADAGGGTGQDPALPPGSEALPGVQLSTLTAEIRRTLKIGDEVQGVVVTEVKPGTDAADKGLSRGDVIVGVGNANVAALEDLTRAVDAAKAAGRNSLLVLVEENGVRRYVALKLS